MNQVPNIATGAPLWAVHGGRNSEYRDFANSVGIDPDRGHNCDTC